MIKIKVATLPHSCKRKRSMYITHAHSCMINLNIKRSNSDKSIKIKE